MIDVNYKPKSKMSIVNYETKLPNVPVKTKLVDSDNGQSAPQGRPPSITPLTTKPKLQRSPKECAKMVVGTEY